MFEAGITPKNPSVSPHLAGDTAATEGTHVAATKGTQVAAITGLVADVAPGAPGDLGLLGINGVRTELGTGPKISGKRVEGIAQLLKKFIKMSSSTERQSQKWGGGRGGDTAVTSQTAEIGKRRTRTHTHTHAHANPKRTERGQKTQPSTPKTGTPQRVPPSPHPVPAAGAPRGCWGREMGRGALLKKNHPGWDMGVLPDSPPIWGHRAQLFGGWGSPARAGGGR